MTKFFKSSAEAQSSHAMLAAQNAQLNASSGKRIHLRDMVSILNDINNSYADRIKRSLRKDARAEELRGIQSATSAGVSALGAGASLLAARTQSDTYKDLELQKKNLEGSEARFSPDGGGADLGAGNLEDARKTLPDNVNKRIDDWTSGTYGDGKVADVNGKRQDSYKVIDADGNWTGTGNPASGDPTYPTVNDQAEAYIKADPVARRDTLKGIRENKNSVDSQMTRISNERMGYNQIIQGVTAGVKEGVSGTISIGWIAPTMRDKAEFDKEREQFAHAKQEIAQMYGDLMNRAAQQAQDGSRALQTMGEQIRSNNRYG